MNVKTIVIWLALLGAIQSEETLSDCGKYLEGWRIASCASGLAQANLISNDTFVSFLQLAISKIKPKTVYYGIGATYGLEQKLVVGSIDHPVFDRQISISYDPREIYGDKYIMDTQINSNLPLLAFTQTDVAELPEWSADMLNGYKPQGEQNMKVAYQANWTPYVENHKRDCAGLNTWILENILPSHRGIVVFMPARLWCPTISGGSVNIAIVGLSTTTHMRVTGEQDTKAVEWALLENQTVGKVPQKFLSDFQ